MGNVMVWNGRRKQPAGGAVGSSGIYRPSFAVGRSPSEIVRARMAELGIGTRLKSGKLALNKGKKNKKAKSGRSAKACDIKGEKISEKEMQNLLARPKVIDKKKAERMAKLLKGKGSKKAGKAKAKPAKKTKPAGKKPAAKKTKPKKAKKTKPKKAVAKKPAAKKPAAKKPAAKRGGKRGKRKGAQVVLASTMTKAREELEKKLSKQGAQLAALQKKLAANGKRGKRRKNTKKANGSRKRSAAVAKRSGRRGSKSAKSATTTRSVSVAKKKKAKGRKRTKAKSSNKARKGKKKGARKSSRKPVAANKKRKGGKRKGGKKRTAGSMKMNNIWRALGITGAKGNEDALVAKLRSEFERRNQERMTSAQEAKLSSQVRKALKKLASVAESEYEPSAKSPGVDPRAVDAALKSLIGLGDTVKKKKVKRKHQLTKREAQAAAAKAAKGKTVKANKKRGKRKAKRSNGKKRKVSLSGALNKAEKTLLAAIAGHDSKLARLLGKKGKKKGGKRKGSSKKSKSQEIAKRAAKSGKKGKSKAKKSNGKRKGKKRKNGAWASGGVNVTDFARNGIRDIVAKNFSDPVSGILVSVPGALVGAAAAHMFPRLVASEWFAKNALTRTLGAAIGGLLGVGVTSFVAGRLSAMGWIDEDQGVIQGGAAALGGTIRTVGQLVTSLTDPTSKLRLLVGTDPSSLADAVNMSDMIPQGRPMLPDGGVMQHNESQDALYEGAPTYGSGNYPDEMADFAMPSSGDIVGDTDGEMSDFAAPEMADFAMPAAGDMTGDTTGEMSDFAAPEMSDFAAPV